MTTLKPIKQQREPLSEAKARIIANLKADGAIWKSGTNYVMKYQVCDSAQLNRFANDLESVYGLDTSRDTHNSGITGRPVEFVYLRSKLAFEDLQKFGPFRSENWRVPKQIRDSSKQIKAAFLMAFFDDEGSVIKSDKTIRLYSINRKGLEEIACLLEEFGIRWRLGKGYGARRNVYAIVIRGLENIRRFSESIGFGVGKKKDKLKSMLSIMVKGGHA